MAATGRNAANERDKEISDSITHAVGSADQDKAIANVITDSHPMGQVTGSGLPHIENAITCAKENS